MTISIGKSDTWVKRDAREGWMRGRIKLLPFYHLLLNANVRGQGFPQRMDDKVPGDQMPGLVTASVE